MTTASDQFDSATVARMAEVSMRQLNHWDRIGLVSPSIAPARGSGSRRRYSVDDLMIVLAVGTLRNGQMGLDQVREVVTGLRSDGLGVDCPPDAYLAYGANKVVYVGTDRSRLIALLQESATLTVLNLELLATRAADLANRHIEPQVAKIAVGRHTYSAVVESDEDNAQYTARCRAFAPSIGRGESIEEACGHLVELIESRKEAEDRPSATQPPARAAKEKRGGAAAWGGDW